MRAVPYLIGSVLLTGVGFIALAACRSCGWLTWGGLLAEMLR